MSAGLRLRRAGVRAGRAARRALGLDRTVYVDQRVGEYRGYWSAAAALLGARFTDLAPGLWEVELDGRRTRIAGHVVGADDPVTLRVAGDKALCHRMAADAGVPVPEHRVYGAEELAALRARVAADPGPWVVKPVRGSASALGVTTGVRTPRGAASAAVLASLQCPEVMLERMVPGESCRLLYLDGELLHAARRRGVRVVGDGRSTVAGLAAAAGAAPVLRDPMTPVTLAAQGLRPASVPAAGRAVLLHGVPPGGGGRELRTVYDESITPLVAPETARALGAVVRALGSRLAGVDLVTVDPAGPLAASAFIEINTTPGIHHHYHTAEERREHPVAVRVLRALLGAPSAEARAPIPHPRKPSMPAPTPAIPGRLRTADYLDRIGVPRLAPATSPFDPGYDPVTLAAHLEQSRHLISILKVSMACWMVADEACTRRKVEAARRMGVPTVTGGGPFEVAVQQGALAEYLDLCADIGFTRVECGEGFTDLPMRPADVMRMVHERGLQAQFELGKKHGGAFTDDVVGELIDQGREWLDAGAVQLVVEGRESAQGVGLFDDDGRFNGAFADRFAHAFGLDTVIFEAPNKPSQFALLDHFGPGVHLCNVRLEETLRVEIYRRGLHSDAFQKENLRPARPVVHFAGIHQEVAR